MHPFDAVIGQFQSTFHRPPTLVARAPGRVNLIGEHTDYTGGWVLPFAILQSVYVAAGPSTANCIEAFSIHAGEIHPIPLAAIVKNPASTWGNYLRGVVGALAKRGFPPLPAQLVIGGDLPIGAGLSSSAALCVATASALAAIAAAPLSRRDIVDMAREAENDFVGMPCGLMDPYASVFGVAGHAIFLDCRREVHELISVELRDRRFVLVDSGVRHHLSDGAYAARVAECGEVLRCMEAATIQEVAQDSRGRMASLFAGNEKLSLRARHLDTENSRVHQMVEALRRNDADRMGVLLNEGHGSLRDNFEVSCPEIEELRNEIIALPGVLGARMVGGGFGGSILVLVDEARVADFQSHFEMAPQRIIEVASGGGAEVLNI